MVLPQYVVLGHFQNELARDVGMRLFVHKERVPPVFTGRTPWCSEFVEGKD